MSMYDELVPLLLTFTCTGCLLKHHTHEAQPVNCQSKGPPMRASSAESFQTNQGKGYKSRSTHTSAVASSEVPRSKSMLEPGGLNI